MCLKSEDIQHLDYDLWRCQNWRNSKKVEISIYHDLSIFVRTNDKSLISVWSNDHILRRRSWNCDNLAILIIQFTTSIVSIIDWLRNFRSIEPRSSHLFIQETFSKISKLRFFSVMFLWHFLLTVFVCLCVCVCACLFGVFICGLHTHTHTNIFVNGLSVFNINYFQLFAH